MKSRIVSMSKMPIDSIDVLSFGNPRAMDARAKAALKNTIESIGFVQPIIVRAHKDRFEILDGHHRFAEMKEQGEKLIDAIIVDVADDVEARKLVLSLNSISADWNYNELSTFVEQILAESAESVESIMAITTFAADDAQIFELASTSFLEDYAAPAPVASLQTSVPFGDAIRFGLVLTVAQNALVFQALQHWKSTSPCDTPDALVAICRAYLEGADK